MPTTTTLPDSHRDLLERPLFAALATVRPDGGPQNNVMWYAWDGSRLRLTHTSARQKFRNMQHEPRVALTVTDPDDGYRFLEVRGTVESIEPDDAEAAFYQGLQRRYGRSYRITDAPERVVVTIRPDAFNAHG